MNLQTIMIRKFQTRYSLLRYGSEVIFYWRNPLTDSLLRIVTSRDNWCVNAISLFVMLKKFTLLRASKIEGFLFEGMTTV